MIHMGRRGKSSRDGMTLIEVVVGMGLFMIGMFAFFALTYQLRRLSSFGQDFTEASLIAEGKVDSLRTATGSGGTNQVGRYTVIWTVTPNASQGNRRVGVSVNWSDLNGNTHAYTTKSILAN